MKDKPKKQSETTPTTEKPTLDNPTNPTNSSTPTTSTETPKETPTTPKTGDDRNPLIWLLLLGIGGCVTGVAWYLWKKDENDFSDTVNIVCFPWSCFGSRFGSIAKD